MPVIKPRAPEYPRPVSPICADEIPTCKGTVLYYDHNDGVEEDEKQRVAKRRRIEAHATSYLRGQPLFLLTAGLRGPFDNGWQNPWARRRTTKTTAKATPSSHHSSKLPKPVDQPAQILPPPAKKPARQVARDAIEDIDPHFTPQEQGQGHRQHGGVPELTPVGNMRTVAPSIFEGCVQLKDQRVENWLRTSEAYGMPGYTHPIPTPPSPSEGRKRIQKSPGPETDVPFREDAVVAITSDDVLRQTPSVKPSKQLTKSFSSPLQDRDRPHGNEAKDFHSSPVKPRAQRTPLENRDSNVLPPSTIESRAEYAILKSRQDTVPLQTTATDPGPHQVSLDVRLGGEADALQQSQPERRLQSPKVPQQDVNSLANVHSTSNDASASLQTAQEERLSKHGEHGPMSPRKQASESGMTTDLPSAQVPDIPILPSLPSNISSHYQMLQDSLHHERLALAALEDIDKLTAVHMPATETMQIGQHAALEQEPQVLTRLEVEADNYQAQVPQEIESIATSKSQLEGASRMVKTLKRPVEGVPKGASPIGVKKPSGLKTRKRQAFVIEDKSGSIKSALKVAKSNTVGEETTTASKKSLEGNAGHQALGIDSHEDIPALLPTTFGPSVPKSILKAVTQHSMRTSTSNAGSSSTKRDAQKQRTLDLVDNDDGFDLEGAIDDLGSFLDTWDAEKQAAGVL